MDWESCLEVEAKLADLQSIFASVAKSDLQEDEGFEKLLKLYTSSERVLLRARFWDYGK